MERKPSLHEQGTKRSWNLGESPRIAVVTPLAEPEKIPLWAEDEEAVDFRSDAATALRCTTAYAAMELKRHLEEMLPEDSVVDFCAPVGEVKVGAKPDCRLVLECVERDRPAGSFAIIPEENGILLRGADRTGLLYAVYAFLEMQGWRWLMPGPAGAVRPPRRKFLLGPQWVIEESPAFALRGFDFAFRSKESVDVLVWMARNRLNLAGSRPSTVALGRKLGMVYKDGGHIFEKILNPDRKLPDGRTLWEAHENWYGIPASGTRAKEEALKTQFCVSQPDLLEFLGEELVRQLEGPWKEADLVSVWGFDTWGSTCSCRDCQSLGNSSDQYMVLLSRLREAIDAATATGRLDRPVRMSGCAYEGTCTLQGPEREIPENLRKAGDFIIFYPIDRSYASDLYDPDCSTNRRYAGALDSWARRDDALPMIVGEYYNVSKYEDLPLLFSKRIGGDLPRYHQDGVTGMTYMHFPLVNWALRAQTQWLYARFTWNPGEDLPLLRETYFEGRYGPWAESMATAYDSIESAMKRIGEWRNWHGSYLRTLMGWDGRRPAALLSLVNGLGSSTAAIEQGRATVAGLDQVIEQLADLREREQERLAEEVVREIRDAENPAQLGDLTAAAPIAHALGEDWRLLRYGRASMALLVATLRYHQGLAEGLDSEAEAAWSEMTKSAEDLEAMWIPIDYEYPGAGLKSLDGLTRSQLASVLRRCRAARVEAGLPW